MTKRQAENYSRLQDRLTGLGFTRDQVDMLLRIERTLQRWAEYECGDSNDRFSRAIERDETTGKPFWVVSWHDENKVRRTPTTDREAGALRRLAGIMRGYPELVAYHQSDPRGCALYIVPKSELNGCEIDSVYNRGVAVCY